MFSKMQRKGASLEQVYDVRALRIIVKRKEDCYAALREVERLWTPVEGRFKVCRGHVRCKSPISPVLALSGLVPTITSMHEGKEAVGHSQDQVVVCCK